MFKLKTAILLTLPLLASPAMAEQAPPPPAGVHDFAAMHKEMCGEHYAREVSHLAYLQARLGLSEQQQAAFNKWRQAVIDQDGKVQAACLAAPVPNSQTPPTILDREEHLEKMLTLELQKLQATKPALAAFYDVLSPEQKALFDRIAVPHHHGFGHMGHGGPMGGMGGHHPMMGPGAGPEAPMPPQDGR